MNEECWLPVAGYEGLYEVSDRGRVRSVDALVANGTSTRLRKGRVLKTLPKDGYRCVSLSGGGVVKRRKVSRLVAAAFVGDVTGVLVDHRDRNKANDRAENLRIADTSQNSRNCKRPVHNTSGIKGVSWDNVNGKWKATLSINGKAKQIGRFADKNDAAVAYMDAARAASGEFACQG